jgi:hypothetical protein
MQIKNCLTCSKTHATISDGRVGLHFLTNCVLHLEHRVRFQNLFFLHYDDIFTGLRRWCINILVTIIILDIIHRSFFYLNHDVPEAVFCYKKTYC